MPSFLEAIEFFSAYLSLSSEGSEATTLFAHEAAFVIHEPLEILIEHGTDIILCSTLYRPFFLFCYIKIKLNILKIVHQNRFRLTNKIIKILIASLHLCLL